MIITCPHCGTRYQVAKEAIGAEGREVQCANCTRAWQARPELTLVPPSPPPAPEPPELTRREETALDTAFEAEEKAVALAETVIAGSRQRRKQGRSAEPARPRPVPAPPVIEDATDRAFSRRQSRLFRQLPQARIRRGVRLAMVIVLFATLAGLAVFRTEIVRQFPALAGVYAGVGLKVNVVGLDIGDVKTERIVNSAGDVLRVEARIRSAGSKVVEVPSVVVTLLDAGERPLYAWSVTPDAADLGPGETISFETRLTSPPAGAARVRLTFASGRTQSEAALDAAAGRTPTPPLDVLAGDPAVPGGETDVPAAAPSHDEPAHAAPAHAAPAHGEH